MENLRDYDLPALKTLLTELGEKPFRAKQLYAWLHQRLAASYEEMTDLRRFIINEI